jgi:hypothetical protein
LLTEDIGNDNFFGIFPFDDNSVDYTTFAELLAASDDSMNDGSELLEWSVVAQSLLALISDDSPGFSSPSYSSETSHGSTFAELGLEFQSQLSEDTTNIANERANTLVGDIGQISPTESIAVAIGSNITAISRYFVSPL